MFCPGFFPIRSIESFLESFLDDDALQFLAEWCRVAVIEQILDAKFDRVHAQLTGDDIDLRFHGKCGLRASRGAVLCAGNLVGIGADGFNLNCRDLVVAADSPGYPQRQCCVSFERRVATDAKDGTPMQSTWFAGAIDPSSERDHARVAVRAGGHLFSIVEHQLDRLASS